MFKRSKTITCVAGLFVALTGIFAGGAWAAGITDTKHNLSTTGTGTIKSTNNTEICVFCHTPHDAIKNNDIPLWNHALSAITDYGVYTSPTFNATDATNVGLGTATVTNLCLSCHDGTVAINNLANPSNVGPAITTMTGTTADGKLPVGNSNLGTSLTNDHPVNFTYDDSLVTADGGTSLKAPGTLTGVKLFSAKVQCASCHDPHSSTNGAFLRVSMTGSALCFACHTK